jgi:hypothetical protein
MANTIYLTSIIPLCDHVYAFKGMSRLTRSAPFDR